MIKTKVLAMIAGLLTVMSLILSLSAPVPASAAPCGGNDANFFGFPTWYRGLSTTDSSGNCSVKFDGSSDEIGSFIWKIVLNIIEIAVRFVAIIAAAYILYGGFTYLTANGSPEKAAKGLNLVMSASIGLIISIASVAIVNTLFGIIPSGTESSNGIYELTATDVLTGAINIVYWIAGAVAVIMFIISGIRFITSAGNPQGIQKARSTMIYSAVGLVIIIIAFTITQAILGFFK